MENLTDRPHPSRLLPPLVDRSADENSTDADTADAFDGAALKVKDDGANAANSDDTYSQLACSINITGGTYTVKTSGDGLDSNGNINITGGYTTLTSASLCGEAGIDYDGTCYIADGTVNNNLSYMTSPSRESAITEFLYRMQKLTSVYAPSLLSIRSPDSSP